MLMKNKAEEAAQQILEMFAEPNNLPKPLANVFVHRNDESPCRKWTWRNQLLVAINGYSDARGFRQWEKVSRKVLKGEKAFRILSPLAKTVLDEESNDEMTVVYGFTGTAVFGLEQTIGNPLPNTEDDTKAWLEQLPLAEVAQAWGLSKMEMPQMSKQELESLVDQYYEWCAARPDESRQTCGRYGPELRIRVDAPINELADMIRDQGYEPTMDRLDILLREMQDNRFDDKHGVCPADVVLDHILSQASGSIELLIENGDFEEVETQERSSENDR